MTKSGTLDQVHTALAAFLGGNQTLAELEMLLAAALGNGSCSQSYVMDALRNAVAAGRVPLDTLRRLGLTGDGDATVHRTIEVTASGEPAEGRLSKSQPIEPNESIAVGQLLGGRYRLKRKLGEGGMGVVYLATDQEVKGEIFAIKVLTTEFRQSPEALKLLLEETRMTRTLAHPNIVGVYSLNVDHNDVFILMEFLEGKTLQALLDEDFGRGMRFDRAWPIIEDVGAALAYAHDRSVIHGDLKPGNVFVTTSGRSKLLDFGIARAARGSGKDTDSLARSALTPAYASCEMLEFLTPDHRDDIYALACIIYEMLSGKHPFGGRNAVQARDAGEKPPPIAALTKRQNAALARGLAFDRAPRTTTVEMLLAGLAHHLDSGKSRGVLIAAVAIFFAATLVYFAADQFWLSKHAAHEKSASSPISVSNSAANPVEATVGFAPAPHSIAVLPFVNMSGDAKQEYFADGITEELLNSLSRLNDLNVVARTSSFSFKGQNVDLSTIAHKLNVGAILEGSVRRAGNTVRITVQLINAVSGFHMWSQTYDRNLSDVLKVQTDVATAVAEQLEIKLVGDEAAKIELGGTRIPAAYDAYLRGEELLSTGDVKETDLRAALAALDQAIALDPNYALAQCRRFAALSNLSIFVDLKAEELARVRGLAVQAAERAVALAPELGEARLALGSARAYVLLDFGNAAPEFDRALALSPGNARVQAHFAAFAGQLGHFEAAVNGARRAVTLDPRNIDSLIDLGQVLNWARRYEEALTVLQSAKARRPNSNFINFNIAGTLRASGQFEQARQMCESPTIPTENPSRLLCLAKAYHGLGRQQDAELALERYKALPRSDTPSFSLATVYAQWGDKEAALEYLATAWQQRNPAFQLLRVDWEFDPIRNEPRFKTIEAAMNFPP